MSEKVIKGETDHCRDRLIKYCTGQGIDLGCGNVKIKFDTIGIDLHHPNADMSLDARDLGCYSNDFFDYVYSSHLLEELENTELALKEWLRVLKPGGHLVLYQADKTEYWPLGDPRCNQVHKHHFTWEELWAILEKIGGTELVHSAPPQGKEWSFELVIKKVFKEQKESINCNRFGDGPEMVPEIKTIVPIENYEGISILIPTLNRPRNIEEFTLAVNKTTSIYKDIEIIFGVHEDDILSINKIKELKSSIKISIRTEIISRPQDGKINLSFLWNQLYKKATYPIIGFFGDDVIFQTPGWDEVVKKEFAIDKAILLYGDDVFIQRGRLATLFFTHKKVHELVGFYLNENFRRWYMDTWWDEVFRKSGKIKYKSNLSFAHMHVESFPERLDDTYRNMETDKHKDQDGRYMGSHESRELMREAINAVLSFKG